MYEVSLIGRCLQNESLPWQALPQQGEVSVLSLEEVWMGADAPGLIHILAAAARNPLVHRMG